MARAREATFPVGAIEFICPGCRQSHQIPVSVPASNGHVWKFNGNFDMPTFHPSINRRTGKYVNQNFSEDEDPGISVICHSWVIDGTIRYENDTTHEMRGQTVNLPELQNE